MTSRWRADLTTEQQAMLTDLLREDLLRYGYEVSSTRVPAQSR
jgi:hypothetical protein